MLAAMMRGWLPCLVLVAACGSKEEKPPQPAPRDLPAEAPVDAKPLVIDPNGPLAGPPAPPPDPLARTPVPAPPPTVAGNCLAESETMAVMVDGDTLRACVDTDFDDVLDRCAKWSKSLGIPRGFEDSDEEIPHKPLAFEDDEDERIEHIDPAIEVCPPDRICVKLMPKVPDDGEVSSMGADAAYRMLAVGITDELGVAGHVEVWDLVAGRLRTKVKLRKLEEDVEYTFAGRFVGNALLAVAIRDDNDMGQGAIHGIDGSFRGELANGSRFLDMGSIHELTPGTIALLDLEAPGVPYAVYTQSLSGRVQRKFVVPMDMDGDDDDAHLHKISNTMLAVSQWSLELRLDVIDLSTGKQTTFRVPSC